MIKKYIDFFKKRKSPLNIMMEEIDNRSSYGCKVFTNIGIYFTYIPNEKGI